MTMRSLIAAARISGPQSEGDRATVFEFRFDADNPTFIGHFPTRPLLPGVFQLEMARMAAELALQCTLGVREICRAKFMRPILPDDVVRLEFKSSETTGMIQARFGFSVAGKSVGEMLLHLCRTE
jgi:3-hydroxymyristoyl/3-hydroxydecanoyl-(acyl carrier protein) dehydratase